MTPSDVKALRRQLGWTQQQLANALHVTATTVARWEGGVHPVSGLVAVSLGLLAKEHGVGPRRHARKAS